MEKVPTPVSYWAGSGAILASLAPQLMDCRQAALVVGQWPPAFFILAVLHKKGRPSQENEAETVSAVERTGRPMATKAEKETQTITKYLGDMHALESHILQALDKQDKVLNDHPRAQQMVSTFHTTLEGHINALEARLQALGGSPTHPVKEAVAAAAGVAAGLYDKVRTEEASKDLRDDYTALNHAVIAYVMLHTTALAFGDQETAALCKRHLTDNAKFVMDINGYMPELVLEELRQDGVSISDQVRSTAQQTVSEVWHQPHQ
jgi:ferritin-like metal-binding protein YciE